MGANVPKLANRTKPCFTRNGCVGGMLAVSRLLSLQRG